MSDLSAIIAAPIAQLWVCPHCETAANRPQCPYCLGNSTMPLQAWLNREEPKESAAA